MTMKKWRGLKALVQDAVHHGSLAIERVHKETARRPFAILEAIPGISIPAGVVHVVHDATVSTVYGAIRVVNGVAGGAIDLVMDTVEKTAPGVEAASPDKEETETRNRNAN